jgi:hypothetical protein
MACTTRRVQFQLEKNSLIETAPILDTNDLTACFYVRADYKRISSENQATIEMMNNGLTENESVCPRGLEARIRKPEYRRRRSMRRLAQEAVLDEQQRQRGENDENDEILLAEIYVGYTKPCLAQAQRQATRDAAVARRIHSPKEQQQLTKKVAKKLSQDDRTEATDEDSSDLLLSSLLSSNADDAESGVFEESLLMKQAKLCMLQGKISSKQSRMDRLFGRQNLLIARDAAKGKKKN